MITFEYGAHVYRDGSYYAKGANLRRGACPAVSLSGSRNALRHGSRHDGVAGRGLRSLGKGAKVRTVRIGRFPRDFGKDAKGANGIGIDDFRLPIADYPFGVVG